MRLRGYMLESTEMPLSKRAVRRAAEVDIRAGLGGVACMVTGATNLAPNGAANASTA